MKSSLDFTRGPPSTGFRSKSSFPHTRKRGAVPSPRAALNGASRRQRRLELYNTTTRVHYLWRQGNKRCRVPDNDTCDQSVTTGHGSLGLGCEKYAIRQHQKRKSFELSCLSCLSPLVSRKLRVLKTFETFCSWYFSSESVHFFGNMILQNFGFPERRNNLREWKKCHYGNMMTSENDLNFVSSLVKLCLMLTLDFYPWNNG